MSVVTDIYIKNFVDQNCLKITESVTDITKHEPLTDGFNESFISNSWNSAKTRAHNTSEQT
jgi:hypothetical protein